MECNDISRITPWTNIIQITNYSEDAGAAPAPALHGSLLSSSFSWRRVFQKIVHNIWSSHCHNSIHIGFGCLTDLDDQLSNGKV